jgi:hypothetical protein
MRRVLNLEPQRWQSRAWRFVFAPTLEPRAIVVTASQSL